MSELNKVKINCKHKLCYKCVKKIIEDRIENKDYILKCPIYYCAGFIKLRDIKKIIGNKHYTILFHLINNEYINHKIDQINNHRNSYNNEINCSNENNVNRLNENRYEFNDENKQTVLNYQELKYRDRQLYNKFMSEKENELNSTINHFSNKIYNKSRDFNIRAFKIKRKKYNWSKRNIKDDQINESLSLKQGSIESSFNNISELNIDDENSSKNNDINYSEGLDTVKIKNEKHLKKLFYTQVKIEDLDKTFRSDFNKEKHFNLKLNKQVFIVNNIKLDHIDVSGLKRYKTARNFKSSINLSIDEKSIYDDKESNINLNQINNDGHIIKRNYTINKNKRKSLKRFYLKQINFQMPHRIKTHFNQTKRYFIRSNFKRDYPNRNKNKKITFLLKDVKSINEICYNKKFKRPSNNSSLRIRSKRTSNIIDNSTLNQLYKNQDDDYKQEEFIKFLHTQTNLNNNFKANPSEYNEYFKNSISQLGNKNKFHNEDKSYFYNDKKKINNDKDISIKNIIYKNNINNSNNKTIPKATMADTIKNLTKKNVIEMSSSQTFLLLNRYKEFYCPNCNEPALYFKLNTNYLKCLNCFTKLCRFCMKTYTENHFDLLFINRCRLYYKRNYGISSFNKSLKVNEMEKLQKVKRFIIMFLLTALSFILLVMLFIKKINNLLKYKKICNSSRNIYFSRHLSKIKIHFLFYNMMFLIIKIINIALCILFSIKIRYLRYPILFPIKIRY